MIDQIIELPIVKSLGWGGMISFLAIIIPFMWKMNPITSLTSTKFERILFSKEKRMFIGFFWSTVIIFISMFYSFILFIMYFEYFATNKSNVDIIIPVISFIFICSMTILYVTGNFNFSMKVSQYGVIDWFYSSRNRKLNLILSLYILFVVSGFSLIPSVFAYTLNEDENFLGDKLSVYIAVLLISNVILVTFSKKIFKALIKKFAFYVGESFYFCEQDGKRWYVYHLAEKSTYLLGDSIDPNNAEVFTTIEKGELLSKKINVYRIPNVLDQLKDNREENEAK